MSWAVSTGIAYVMMGSWDVERVVALEDSWKVEDGRWKMEVKVRLGVVWWPFLPGDSEKSMFMEYP